MKKILFLLIFQSLPIFFVISFCLFNIQLKAQDFEVAPVKLDFAVEPGDMESKTVIIRNHANKKQAFVLTLADWTRDSLGNKIGVSAGTSKRSCRDWITINPSFLEINPNEAQNVEVLMQVPADGYSTRWAMIYVKATRERTILDADKIVAAGISISPRIAIQVFQSPKSNTKYKAMISNFREITGKQDTVRTFKVRIDNVGDKTIECKVYLIASNLETAKERKLTPVRVSLYPDELRIVELKLPPGLEKGMYSLVAILDYGHRTNLEAVQMQIRID